MYLFVVRNVYIYTDRGYKRLHVHAYGTQMIGQIVLYKIAEALSHNFIE